MPDNETLSAAAFFIVAILAAAWGYMKKPSMPPTSAAAGSLVSAAIGLGWLEKDQAERMLGYLERNAKAQERMASSLEALADKRTSEIKDTIEDLMDVMRNNERLLREADATKRR